MQTTVGTRLRSARDGEITDGAIAGIPYVADQLASELEVILFRECVQEASNAAKMLTREDIEAMAPENQIGYSHEQYLALANAGLSVGDIMREHKLSYEEAEAVFELRCPNKAVTLSLPDLIDESIAAVRDKNLMPRAIALTLQAEAVTVAQVRATMPLIGAPEQWSSKFREYQGYRVYRLQGDSIRVEVLT